MGHLSDNRFAVIRKIIRSNADNYANHKANGRGSPDSPFKSVEKPGGSSRQHNKEQRGGIGRRIQGLGRISVLSHTRAGNSDDGSQQADGRVTEYHRAVHTDTAIQRLGHHQRRSHSRHVRIKKVRTHTGHVAHIVPHIIRDNRRIPGIVLGNAQLYLSCQVSRHIRRLGKDAAACFGKQSQRTGPEGKAQKHRSISCNHQHRHHAQQTKTHYGQAHDRSAAETDQKRRFQAPLRAFRSSGIGLSRHQNSDFPCDSRQNRTRQIGSHHRKIIHDIPIPDGTWQENQDQYRRHTRESGKDDVLFPHEGIRPCMNQIRNFNDSLICRRLSLHPEMQIYRICERYDYGKERNCVNELHKIHISSPISIKVV